MYVTIVKVFLYVVSDKSEGKPVSVERKYFLLVMISTTSMFTVFQAKHHHIQFLNQR